MIRSDSKEKRVNFICVTMANLEKIRFCVCLYVVVNFCIPFLSQSCYHKCDNCKQFHSDGFGQFFFT